MNGLDTTWPFLFIAFLLQGSDLRRSFLPKLVFTCLHISVVRVSTTCSSDVLCWISFFLVPLSSLLVVNYFVVVNVNVVVLLLLLLLLLLFPL